MSLQYHFAEAITGSCTMQVTKSPGGKTYRLMHLRPLRTCGNKLIQRMGGLMRKLNRLFTPAKQRLRINGYGKTNHCKSTKCQTQHRASNGIRETPLEGKCHSPRTHRRNSDWYP